MFMTYSMKRDEKMLKAMIEHYGIENIPNPEHWPMRFEFMVKSFEHYLRMKEGNDAKE